VNQQTAALPGTRQPRRRSCWATPPGHPDPRGKLCSPPLTRAPRRPDLPARHRQSPGHMPAWGCRAWRAAACPSAAAPRRPRRGRRAMQHAPLLTAAGAAGAAAGCNSAVLPAAPLSGLPLRSDARLDPPCCVASGMAAAAPSAALAVQVSELAGDCSRGCCSRQPGAFCPTILQWGCKVEPQKVCEGLADFC